MKIYALAIALLMGGTALAQTSTTSGTAPNSGSGDMAATTTQPASDSGSAGYTSQSSTTDMNGQAQTATDSSADQSATTAGSNMANQTQTGWNATSGQTNVAMNSTNAVVQPSNANPRRDERGIRVISLPAIVPGGYNGIASTGMGGPMVDPTTGQAINDTGSYPACSRRVTDKCLQTYERTRRR